MKQYLETLTCLLGGARVTVDVGAVPGAEVKLRVGTGLWGGRDRANKLII